MGLRTIQDYRVINLWEVDADLVFQQPLPSLLPFVPVLRGGTEESVVRRALQVLRTDEQVKYPHLMLRIQVGLPVSTALPC